MDKRLLITVLPLVSTAMFKAFRIGSVLGIPIKLDITFLLILPVFAWIIGVQIEPLVEILEPLVPGNIDPEAVHGGYRHWLMGLAGALGLFLCVALHELGHSVAAMRYQYHIASITLWIFGGIAQLTDTPEHWRHEFVIAIAGPIVSLVLAVISYLPLFVIDAPSSVVFLLAYLAVMNAALAAFNMLPAFPMDGGRVLRALLARNRSLPRATKLASEIGKSFAVLLGIFGLFTFNIILIGIAFFVYIAASGEAERTMVEAALAGVSVEDIMTPVSDLKVVGPRDSVADLLERMFRERYTGFPVVRAGRPVGMVTLTDAQAVDPVEREAFEVRDIMSSELETIEPTTDAFEAIQRMQEAGVGRLLVIDEHGELRGLISRTDLMRAVNIMQSSGDWDREGMST